MIRTFIAALLLASVSAAGAAEADLARKYFAAVRSQLDPRAQSALDHVDGLGRQLLATRGYLRAGAGLDQRWSWTQQQIEDYAGSEARIAFDAEVARVRATFEMLNPGYSLFVNSQVRSLDLQLQRWNNTASITRASEHMKEKLEAALRQPGFPPPGTDAGIERFRQLVASHAPQPVPTLAAPGLSAHGRMNAVDFQVQQGNHIIAGPDSRTVESVWIGQGWRDRLHTAVVSAGNRFEGPLASPAEPWHYNYVSP